MPPLLQFLTILNWLVSSQRVCWTFLRDCWALIVQALHFSIPNTRRPWKKHHLFIYYLEVLKWGEKEKKKHTTQSTLQKKKYQSDYLKTTTQYPLLCNYISMDNDFHAWLLWIEICCQKGRIIIPGEKKSFSFVSLVHFFTSQKATVPCSCKVPGDCRRKKTVMEITTDFCLALVLTLSK